jgi:hypothetical protein
VAALPVLLLRTAGPWLVKQLPKLWPLLLESHNRERLAGVLKDLASRSPGQRLRAQADLTAALAERMAQQAATPDEAVRAQDWQRRARNLALRLDMPVAGGRDARKAHRASVQQQLEQLQGEMDRHLEA